MDFETGLFLNKIPYAKTGHGEKRLILFPPTHHLLWNVMNDAEDQLKGYKRLIPPEFTLYILGYDPNLPPTHTSEAIAADFAEIIRKHIGPSTIMAVSFGGSVAIPFAALYPELVTKLILMVTTYGTSGSGLSLGEKLLTLANEGKIFTLEQQIDELYANTFMQKLMKMRTWKNWPKKERIMNPISTFINGYQHLVDTAEDRKKYLPKIQAPTLIIGGTEDQFASQKFYETTAELIPNAHLELFEGETHTVVIEKILSVRKIIRGFLIVEEDSISYIKKLSVAVPKILKKGINKVKQLKNNIS